MRNYGSRKQFVPKSDLIAGVEATSFDFYKSHRCVNYIALGFSTEAPLLLPQRCVLLRETIASVSIKFLRQATHAYEVELGCIASVYHYVVHMRYKTMQIMGTSWDHVQYKNMCSDTAHSTNPRTAQCISAHVLIVMFVSAVSRMNFIQRVNSLCDVLATPHVHQDGLRVMISVWDNLRGYTTRLPPEVSDARGRVGGVTEKPKESDVEQKRFTLK